MARRALAAKEDVIYWGGKLPEDAPANQTKACYRDTTEDEEPWLRIPSGPVKDALMGTDWGESLR